MKPDWKTAPHWANYYAQDMNGCCFWYHDEPYIPDGFFSWIPTGNGQIDYSEFDYDKGIDWKQTLEKRPEIKR